MRLFILPYKQASTSAKALAERLGVVRINGSKRLKLSDVVLRWGNGPDVIGTNNIINNEAAIACNKLSTFEMLKDNNIPTVDWTCDANEANSWLDGGDVVLARTNIVGSKGDGIQVLSAVDWADAKLYTKYMKAHEYRVHVFAGSVIDVQKKRRRNGAQTDSYIKNANGGWVFCRDNITSPKIVYAASIAAVGALGLQFGAVDILYREADKRAAVLEVNTAPGLEGTTLENYANAINKFITRA